MQIAPLFSYAGNHGRIRHTDPDNRKLSDDSELILFNNYVDANISLWLLIPRGCVSPIY